MLKDKRIIFPKNGDGVHGKKILKFEREEEEQDETNCWHNDQFGLNKKGKNEMTGIYRIKNIFSKPKPATFMRNVNAIANAKDNDIILDFVAGSATTAHAVLQTNKNEDTKLRFLLIQLPEEVDEKSEVRKTGYKTIADIAKERIRRVIKGYGDDPMPIDDGFKVFKLGKSNYIENQFEFDPEKSENENKKAFSEYLKKSKQSSLFSGVKDIDIVYENIVKEGLSLNSKISSGNIGKNKIYNAVDNEREIFLCLDKKIESSAVKEIINKFKEKHLFV